MVRSILSDLFTKYLDQRCASDSSNKKKDAVALKMFTPSFTEDQVVLEVAPLSAGVLTIEKKF